MMNYQLLQSMFQKFLTMTNLLECNVEPNVILKYDDSELMKFIESLRNTRNHLVICVKTYPDLSKLLKNLRFLDLK